MADPQTNLASAGGPGARSWDLLLSLPRDAPGPLHVRLSDALRAQVRSGRLPAGTPLPPSRRMAEELGCSRWAVTEAYSQLVAEGYLEAVQGSATRVAWTGAGPDGEERPVRPAGSGRRPVPVRHDLAPGLPDLRMFPRRRWVEAVRAATTDADLVELGLPEPAGQARLRHVLAEHVVRSRAAVASAADVVVSTSVSDSVRRLGAAMRARGIDAVACEDPGWARLRDVLEQVGVRVEPVPVDGHGMVVGRLESLAGVRAVLVTAAHQFPTGSVLAPQRRAELLDWARRVDGVVLEDDYDAEYRFDRAPVAALQGMDPSRVVLLKSTSKTLSPALGIGWMVVPPEWRAHLAAVEASPHTPPSLDQLALARLIESGAYDRHLRACRSRYRRRRDLLVESLSRHLPAATVTGAAAGLHCVVDLSGTVAPGAPPGRGVRLVRAARDRGLGIATLDRYAVSGAGDSDCVVVGYGNLADTAVDEAVRLLADTWREVSSSGE